MCAKIRKNGETCMVHFDSFLREAGNRKGYKTRYMKKNSNFAPNINNTNLYTYIRMAFLTKNDNETSCFLVGCFEGIERQFTDKQELSAQGYTQLLRAKRYGRWYVLKTLNEDVADQNAYVSVLRKELEILMLMQHPGVVQTIGMEDVEGVGPAIIMEYIDGETLADLLPKIESIPIEQRRRMAYELCETMAYIHSQGVVHRDLKPENIMVTRNGNRIKVIDFGMADTDQHAILKQPAGTVNYMAPEQAQQSFPDVRNDIYSLGLVLNNLQLGRPYRQVIARCQRPIAQRYQNMNEMIADMDRIKDRRRKQYMWGAGLILAAMLAIVGLQTWRLYEMHGAMNRVESSRDNALKELHKKMEETQVEQHIDTLTLWSYHWEDLNSRLMDVCQFIYTYTDKLPKQYSEYERGQIRETMLDDYRQWNERLNNRMVAIKRRDNDK